MLDTFILQRCSVCKVRQRGGCSNTLTNRWPLLILFLLYGETEIKSSGRLSYSINSTSETYLSFYTKLLPVPSRYLAGTKYE